MSKNQEITVSVTPDQLFKIFKAARKQGKNGSVQYGLNYLLDNFQTDNIKAPTRKHIHIEKTHL